MFLQRGIDAVFCPTGRAGRPRPPLVIPGARVSATPESIRRNFVPGGSFFFTVNLAERRIVISRVLRGLIALG
jgi:hypothetical protein